MFTITLLQANGSRKGTRYKIDTSPYVIGRNESCDLTFASRTVSRKHTAIIFDDSNVLVRDLESRNGTKVDGDDVAPSVPVQLSHHNEIRIGKYTFRVSIRDRESRRPHRPERIDLSTLSGAPVQSSDQEKDAEQLLSELDALASRLEFAMPKSPLDKIAEAAQNRPVEVGVESSEESSNVNSAAQTDKQSDEPSVPGTDDTVHLETSAEIDPKPDGDADDENDKKPQKIPGHLRPKGPKDSQDAATAALRNLFVR